MSTTAQRQACTAMAQAAHAYAARGWSVIPMQARGKRPLVAWREFQQRRATAEAVAKRADDVLPRGESGEEE